MRTFQSSLQLDIRSLRGKTFKIVADTIRSAIKNEHGFGTTKGVTDSRLKAWPVVVRFSTPGNRNSFEGNLQKVLAPRIHNAMNIRYLRPVAPATKPVRMASGA